MTEPKPTNPAAEEAFLIGSQYGQLYARLDCARSLLNDAINLPRPPLESKDFDELFGIRQRLNGFIGMILDASKRDAHRICQKPNPTL